MRVVAWTAGAVWFLICTSLSYTRFAHRAPASVVLQHGAVQPPPAMLEPAAVPAVTPSAVPAEAVEGENPAWDHSLDATPERVAPPPAAAPDPSVPALPPTSILPGPPTRTLTVPPPSSGLATPPTILPPGKPAGSATNRKPKSHKEKTAKTADATNAGEQTGSAAPEPAARCLECGAPAASWVEVDGKRVGYCRKHYSKLDRPRASRKRTRTQPQVPPVPADPGSPTATEELSPARQEPAAEAAPVQCRGVTKDGARCRRKTKDPSGFCYQHRPR